MSKKVWTWWILLYALITFLAFNRHSRGEQFNYHSELWSDKAGYYVYLPALFYYNFEADQFPEDVDERTGRGFKLDLESNKLLNKYPQGVSILLLPFWSVAAGLRSAQGLPNDGFATEFHKMLDLAAPFYLIFGLICFFLYIRPYFKGDLQPFLVCLALVLSGNLLHYSVEEVGLSHVYSFALISLLLLMQKKYSIERSTKKLIYLALVAGLIVSIRNLNVLVLPFVLLLDNSWKNYLRKELVLGLIVAAIPLIPQLLFNQYMGDDAMKWGYEREGFLNASNPHIYHVLFAPQNGFLLYFPLALLMFWGMTKHVTTDRNKSYLIAGIFSLFVVIYGSWWSWQLGCGFGHRGFVEFHSLLAVPLVFVFAQAKSKTQWIIAGITLLCILYNLKLTFTYDYCWQGVGPWDWNEWFRLLTAPTK